MFFFVFFCKTKKGKSFSVHSYLVHILAVESGMQCKNAIETAKRQVFSTIVSFISHYIDKRSMYGKPGQSDASHHRYADSLRASAYARSSVSIPGQSPSALVATSASALTLHQRQHLMLHQRRDLMLFQIAGRPPCVPIRILRPAVCVCVCLCSDTVGSGSHAM